MSVLRIPSPTSAKLWQKGLLIGANHVGDILCLTPSFKALHTAFPNCTWDIVVSPPANEILKGNPSIGQIITIDHSRTLGHLWKRVRPKLAAQKYDVFICYDQGQAWMDLFIALSLRIPNRVGYVHKGFSALWTFPIVLPANFPSPIPDCFRCLISQVIGRAPNWTLRPEVFTDANDDAQAEVFFRRLELESAVPPYLCFVKSRQKYGVPPSHLFINTLKELIRLDPRPIILSGGPGDAELLHHLAMELPSPTLVEAGELGLRGLVSMMRRCRAVITPDSGPRQLANTTDIPVFFFRNIWFDRRFVGSYSDKEVDLVEKEELVAPEDEAEVWARYHPSVIAEKIFRTLVSLNAGHTVPHES